MEQFDPEDHWQPDYDSLAAGPAKPFLGAMIVLALAFVLFVLAGFFIFTHVVAPLLNVLAGFGGM